MVSLNRNPDRHEAPFTVYAPRHADAHEMAPAPKHLVVLIARSNDAALCSPGWAVLTGRLAETPGQALRVVLIGEHRGAPESMEAAEATALPEGAFPVDVYVLAGDIDSDDPGLPSALILALGELSLRKVSAVTLDGVERPYRRTGSGGPKLLYLFPGSIHPVTMGAHRRAATMLVSLLRHGFTIEVLYTGPNAKARRAASAFLSLVAVQATPFSNRRDRLATAFVALRKWLRMLSARLGGNSGAAVETFIERARLRNNKSLRTKLNHIGIDRFDVVMINYAWMAPAVLATRPQQPMLICDTHDVQYYRDASQPEPVRAFLFPTEKEKRVEIELLRRMDKVLAISQRDAELLSNDLGADRVCAAPPSFAYCYRPVRTASPNVPLRFGFIGHRMKANVDALAIVLDDWWPAIRRWSPESTLHVAGSVCADTEFRRRSFLDSSVRALGFVDSIVDFYAMIDVALSPVVVAGGMNFKNAEALTAGVAVITNRLGAETLQPLRLSSIAESADDVIAVLRRMETDPEGDRVMRAALQAEALRAFCTDDAMTEIVRSLGGRADACAS